MNVMIIGVLF